MSWTLDLNTRARKELSALPQEIRWRIQEALVDLTENPRPPGHKKLKGQRDHYRIRIGDYRVIYTIDDGRLHILVVRIAHRRESYR